MNNLNKLINTCPKEIIYLIMSYTINPQPILLRDDIKNYYTSKIIISELYYQRWIESEDKNWLINDIIAYINDFQPTMYGYSNRFFNLWLRNRMIINGNDVNIYYNLLEKKSVESQINLFWGILTPIERTEIILL